MNDSTLANLIAHAKKRREGAADVLRDYLLSHGMPEDAAFRMVEALGWPEGIRARRHYDTVAIAWGSAAAGSSYEFFRDLNWLDGRKKVVSASNFASPYRLPAGDRFWLERVRVDISAWTDGLRRAASVFLRVNRRPILEVPLRVLFDAGRAGVPVETEIPAPLLTKTGLPWPAAFKRGPWAICDADDLVGRLELSEPIVLPEEVRVTLYLEGYGRSPLG